MLLLLLIAAGCCLSRVESSKPQLLRCIFLSVQLPNTPHRAPSRTAANCCTPAYKTTQDKTPAATQLSIRHRQRRHWLSPPTDTILPSRSQISLLSSFRITVHQFNALSPTNISTSSSSFFTVFFYNTRSYFANARSLRLARTHRATPPPP